MPPFGELLGHAAAYLRLLPVSNEQLFDAALGRPR